MLSCLMYYISGPRGMYNSTKDRLMKCIGEADTGQACAQKIGTLPGVSLKTKERKRKKKKRKKKKKKEPIPSQCKPCN